MGRSVAAAGLAGALVAAGGAPLELWSLTMLAPGALFAALTPGDRPTLAEAVALGGVTGFTANALSMYWVVGLLERFGGLPTALAVLVGALLWLGQSLPWMLAAWLAAASMRAGARGWLALPAALTVAHTLAPALFPWRYGLSQLSFLPFAQVAELGGLPLLDWLVATIGCGSVAALRDGRRGAAVAALLALALPPLFGLARLDAVRAQRAAAPILRVGVAQPNVSIAAKHDPRRFLDQLRLLQSQSRTLEAQGAELVVWPETAYRFPVVRGVTRDRAGPLAIRAEGMRAPLIVGVLTTTGTPRRHLAIDADGRGVATFTIADAERFNSAIALEPDGRITGVADKVHPLLFGEHTPLWEHLPFRESIPRGISAGEGYQILELAGARITILNCYEDLLYDYVRAQARAEPDLLVNITNDAWFGDTSAPHLHHMNARLRAIETRRDLVRATNTGVSGHTAATGEDLVRTDTFVRARFVAEARLLRGTTPYVRLGDWVSPLCLGGLLGFVFARWRLTG